MPSHPLTVDARVTTIGGAWVNVLGTVKHIEEGVALVEFKALGSILVEYFDVADLTLWAPS